MKDRIKKIRKDSGLNQTEFAESVGLSRNMIAQVETGQNSFSDRSIRDICRIYNVNEDWLRSGVGDPYGPKSRNEQIADFVNEVMESDDSFKSTLIYGLSNLDFEDWQELERIIVKLASRHKNQPPS